MIARRLIMQLKPNTKADFRKVLENSVLPLLRKQKGFQESMVFAGPNANDAFVLSLWDGTENAEAYGRTIYPEVMKSLSNFIEGTPQVHPFELLASTLPMKALGTTA